MLMRVDYHVHSDHSFDCSVSAADMCRQAARLGVDELCFTNHVDFDWCNPASCDVAAQTRAVASLNGRFAPRDLTVLNGAEVGLAGEEAAAAARAYLAGRPLDFVIGSLHMVDGLDAYYPEYFEGHTQEENYARYIRRIEPALRAFPEFSAVGHFDFVAKHAPYDDRRMTYDAAPEAFDSLFRFVAERGKCIEINTSAWLDDPAWGLDILTRYRELGGEYVTVGSDAHMADRVSRRFDEAVALAKAAGIRYIATFRAMEPALHPISEF